MHGTKCSGTEQNVLVREPSVLACRIPPVRMRPKNRGYISFLNPESQSTRTVVNFIVKLTPA